MPETLQPYGRGIPILRTLCKSVEYGAGGATATVTLACPSSHAA